ncbi:PREDICTED: uncharacterized protein LOC109185023 [Ipomoea nil]|uniref:uncharacterized protein LOC109185023 n=1 Tax=Ipomoea nil TaxID=35883 RepID=UPI000900A422|nr:PREDICTED: uncharacterized protein LOC109185023 [Ipomoea nil]
MPISSSKMNNFAETNEVEAKWPDTGGTNSKGNRSLDDMMDIGGSTRKNTNKKWKDQITDVLKSVSATMSSKEQCRKAREEASTMSTAAATPYTMKTCIEIFEKHECYSPLCH